ncbi:MAG: SprT family zinc-dependent metalloprotease, partial [Rikenellaceae bacterium]
VIIVTFSIRRTITIRLEPGDSRIFIKAPVGMSENEILLMVAKKQRWIKKRLSDIKDRETHRRNFTDGSTHLLLGEPFTLKVEEGKNNISFENEILTITTPKTDPTNVEKQLYKWYAQQTKELFPKILAPLMRAFMSRHDIIPTKIEYKRVKSYWGQCVGKSYIRLNIELVRARQSTIEMIFLHELCHLVQPNHSKRFYALLDSHCPKWKDEIAYLKNNVALKY